MLPEVLRSAGIERPVLVGHSDGASIALIHASEHPGERARADGAARVRGGHLRARRSASTRETFERGGLRERMARHHDDPEVTFSGWSDVWLDPEFRSWNLEPLLAGIDAPALLIQGADDEYGTLAQIEAVERGLSGPVARLVLQRRPLASPRPPRRRARRHRRVHRAASRSRSLKRCTLPVTVRGSSSTNSTRCGYS